MGIQDYSAEKVTSSFKTPCYVCGRKATTGAVDQREVSYDGKTIERVMVRFRFGCENHPVHARLFRINGKVEEFV